MSSTPLPKGIRRVFDGQGRPLWRVSDGTGSVRFQGDFCDEREAREYKKARAAWRATDQPLMSPDEWRTGLIVDAETASASSSKRRNAKTIDEMAQTWAHFKATKNRERLIKHAGLLLRHLGSVDVTQSTPVRALPDDTGVRLRDHFAVAGYARVTAAAYLRDLTSIVDLAIKRGHATVNPFSGVDAVEPVDAETRKMLNGRIRNAPKPEPWSLQVGRMIAALLPKDFQPIVWFLWFSGLRAGELAGLVLADLEDEAISVTMQRLGSAEKGRTSTKTERSVRHLPLPTTIAALLREYVAAHHGLPPSDPKGRAEWEKRYVFVGLRGGALDIKTLRKHINRALEELGLSHHQLKADVKPLHIFRYLYSMLLQSFDGELPRRVAQLLGHAGGPHDSDLSPTTTQHYSSITEADRSRLKSLLDEKIDQELQGQLFLDVTTDRTITFAKAAELVGGASILTSLISDGTVSAVTLADIDDSDPLVLVHHGDLIRYLRRCAKEAETCYSEAETLARTKLGYVGLADRIAAGEIELVSTNGRVRHSYPVVRCIGGGKQYTKTSVDAYCLNHAERIHRVEAWMSVAVAARHVGVEESTIRRRCDDGTLESWRDPHSGAHQNRYVNPLCLPQRTELVRVNLGQVARRLGLQLSDVRWALTTAGYHQPTAANVASALSLFIPGITADELMPAASRFPLLPPFDGVQRGGSASAA